MRFEGWFVWEHLTAPDALKRISNQMGWHRCVFHITIVTPKIVGIVNNKGATTGLTLTFNHFFWLRLQ